MVRRPKVKRHPNGTPLLEDRCQAAVLDESELFPRRCRKARLRGLAFCEIHRDRPTIRKWESLVAESYTDEIDAAAQDLITVLDRLPT